MKIAVIIITLLFYIIFPALILRLCHLSKLANKIGAVLICYLVGMIFGQFILNEYNKDIPEILSTAIIPLALPMLLFELNIRSWRKVAGKAFVSMIISVICLIATITIGYTLFQNGVYEANKVGGMLSGVYTGGTPNLASLKAALNVREDVYIAVNTVDMVVSAVYILFLISIAKRVFGKILLPYPHKVDFQDENIEEKRIIKRLKKWIRLVSVGNILAAFGVSILIAVIGAGVGFAFIKDNAIQMAVIILTITTLAIIASNIKVVKKIRGSFDVGMYLILIFSIAVASMANFENMTKSILPLLGFISIAIFGTLVLHILFSKIFKVDVDTMIVTSTSLICSPPFVPVVCAAIKNKEVMMSGITVGVIGYALGNYLGVFISYFLGQL
ncbi:MAG: DUF819 family protein [Prevotellaceae bacterium]|jgi:uncharacterized membrane protein|nr:DUF819 family protein [Prevotellaceae bacterium]